MVAGWLAAASLVAGEEMDAARRTIT